MSLAPRARFELGLDVVAPRIVRPRHVPRLLAYVATGKESFRGSNVAYLHDVDRVALRSEAPVPLQADGEDLGDAREVIFECERSALSVLV
jgi:hypothetical protein